MSTSRYARDLDLSELNAHTQGILLTPAGSRVLDVGTADGHPVVEALVARGCKVWGVEIDEEAAATAAPLCERMVVGNVETLDIAAEFAGCEFDVILCLDVLEHLVEPAATLKHLAPLLAPGGVIVASIPNVTHAAIRLQLLEGEFTYTDTGLLDRTHLRFFDRAGIEQLFADADLTITDRLAVLREPHETEISIDLAAFPPETVAEVTADPDARVFQWIITARPQISTDADPSGLLTRLFEQTRNMDSAARQTVDYIAWLEEQVRAKGSSDERAADLERAVRERVAELLLAQDQLRALKAELVVKDEYLAEALGKAGLDRPMQTTPTYDTGAHAALDRALARLQRHPRMFRAIRWAGRKVMR
jgi:2-polyprenyl-3-methyl-5-hydroxy-6-metoxy-1,4-benzoquinol methylase